MSFSSSNAGKASQADKTVAEAVKGQESEIKSETKEGARILTLNRPKALNALTEGMIDSIYPLLQSWEGSKSCNLIILKGEGRAFCAGGDVVALTENARNPETRSKAVDFFKKEYECDRYIAHMKKPIVTFMDGTTMGGGVGLSVHAPFRIATEKTVFAMPETNIGLFPDVGANFFLSRLDGEIGTYLGLTSERLTGYGVFLAGIATHYVPSDRLEALEERLSSLSFSADADSTSRAGLKKINACIEEVVGNAGAAKEAGYDLIGSKRLAVDACFAPNRAEEVVAALQQLEESKSDSARDLKTWAKKTRETIEQRSPTSVKVALEGIRQGAKLNINEVFDLDMQIAAACCNPDIAPDFVTGVTHLLKEKKKDRAAWSPSTLQDISHDQIREIFFSPPADDAVQLTSAPAGRPAYTEYPHAGFALPSEKLIAKVVKGETSDSGSFAPTEKDVMQWFQREWDGKIGVKEKVQEVLKRKTKRSDDGTLWWR